MIRLVYSPLSMKREPAAPFEGAQPLQHLKQQWSGKKPIFCCVVGFTETCLIPGISAAGATPEARRYTAIADAEVLLKGYSARLPTAPEGFPSPVVLSKGVLNYFGLETVVLNGGLSEPSNLPMIAMGEFPARCLSTGQALTHPLVQDLWTKGYTWGQKNAQAGQGMIIGECVAGGTTTALAVMLGLGIQALGRVNSSHRQCNHPQKESLVQQGLAYLPPNPAVWDVLAAVGDPMQPLAAGVAMGASLGGPVILAGGTQMLAVAAVCQRLALEQQKSWDAEHVIVGTTRWVADDLTGDTGGLAAQIGAVPLVTTEYQLYDSAYAGLRAYEQGYVKEGVGAGGLMSYAAFQDLLQNTWIQAVDRAYQEIVRRK
ncbi:MAG: TIGR00303 family protein [Gloeobacterales cyanobacterium]